MNDRNPSSKAVTVLTAAKITELTTKFPNLGIDTFIHERDYNQMANGREELRQRFERACARITELESAVETTAEAFADKLCERIKEMRGALYTYSPDYGESIGGPLLDGVLDAIDELCPAEKSNGDVCTCEKPEPALMDHGLASLCEKCYRPIGSQK